MILRRRPGFCRNRSKYGAAMTDRAEIYLLIDTGPGAADRLRTALATCDVPCVLIRLAVESEADDVSARTLVQTAQAAGAAALIEDNAVAAREWRADGVHLSGSRDILQRYQDARGIVGATGLVGAVAGKSRHDAMMLGEAGADYVAFGVPPDVKDLPSAKARRHGMVEWWAQLFEVPSVAFDVSDAAEAADLAAAGADFVTCAIESGASNPELVATLASFADAIRLSDKEVVV